MTELHSGLPNAGCHVKTIIKSRTYTFNWTVENCSIFELGTELKSPTFCPFLNQTFYATLKIGENYEGYFKFHHIPATSIEVKHNLSIENSAGQVILEKITMHKYIGNSSCGDLLPSCINTMKRASVENLLIIKCVMIFCGENNTDISCNEPCSVPVSPLADLSALSKDLNVMFEESVYADISLNVDDSVVRVHKSVVCARSSVFSRMFETPMGEKEKSVVNITDLELPVLRDLVSYLYTGVLAKDDFKSVFALYYAADKYDVSILRKTCATVLLSKLDVENACSLLTLANQHSDVELKNSVIKFIKFSFAQVLETEAWGELVKDAPRLATEVFSIWSKNRSNKA